MKMAAMFVVKDGLETEFDIFDDSQTMLSALNGCHSHAMDTRLDYCEWHFGMRMNMHLPFPNRRTADSR